MSGSSEETAGRRPPGWLQPLLELGPLLVFFVTYLRVDIYWATGVFMVAMLASVAASWFIRRKLPVMPIFVLVFILVFGTLTLWLQDETFIKMRPTISNISIAAMLWAGLAFGQPLLKYAFSSLFQLTDPGWRSLTLRWSFFFVFLAVVNEVVWRNFSTDFWVAFKVFGNLPLTAIFAMAQIPLMSRYALDDEATADTARDERSG